MPNKSVRAAAEGLPKPMSAIEALSALDGRMHDAVNMSEIACEYLDDAQRRKADGHYHIHEEDMRTLAFAVCHTATLINAAKRTWDETWDAAVREKGGAA